MDGNTLSFKLRRSTYNVNFFKITPSALIKIGVTGVFLCQILSSSILRSWYFSIFSFSLCTMWWSTGIETLMSCTELSNLLITNIFIYYYCKNSHHACKHTYGVKVIWVYSIDQISDGAQSEISEYYYNYYYYYYYYTGPSGTPIHLHVSMLRCSTEKQITYYCSRQLLLLLLNYFTAKHWIKYTNVYIYQVQSSTWAFRNLHFFLIGRLNLE